MSVVISKFAREERREKMIERQSRSKRITRILILDQSNDRYIKHHEWVGIGYIKHKFAGRETSTEGSNCRPAASKGLSKSPGANWTNLKAKFAINTSDRKRACSPMFR